MAVGLGGCTSGCPVVPDFTQRFEDATTVSNESTPVVVAIHVHATNNVNAMIRK